MTFNDWTIAVDPKVQGTWNLHNAITSDLDFFILYGSYGSIGGQWGQANYAAANTFLDSFVRYRHQKGLPASVIDIGVMGEVGFVAQSPDMIEFFHKLGMQILKEQDLLDAMVLALDRSNPLIPPGRGQNGAYTNPSQVLLGLVTTIPIAAPSTRVVWKRDARMGIYHNLNSFTESSASDTGTSSSRNALKGLAQTAAAHPEILELEDTTKVIAKAISSTLSSFLIKDEDSIKLEHSLESLGIDSLVAMELRNWIRQQLEVDISVFTIVQSPSLLQLGDNVRTLLIDRFQAPSS